MVINASHYMLATGCLSGMSLFLHLLSAGNFLPDEEVWLLGTVFWYLHYWLNFVARLCLLSSTVLVGLEVYAPNMVTSYTSVDGKTLKMYLTKLLAISAACIFVRFILPGPVTSFGRIYKLGFMMCLSAAVINVVEQSQSGDLGTVTRRWGMKKKDSEDSNHGEDRRRRLGKSKYSEKLPADDQ